MRKTYQGSQTWVEVTDHTWTDELKYMVDALRALKFQLKNVEVSINDLYWQRREKIYKEGTTETIKYEEE